MYGIITEAGLPLELEVTFSIVPNASSTHTGRKTQIRLKLRRDEPMVFENDSWHLIVQRK